MTTCPNHSISPSLLPASAPWPAVPAPPCPRSWFAMICDSTPPAGKPPAPGSRWSSAPRSSPCCSCCSRPRAPWSQPRNYSNAPGMRWPTRSPTPSRCLSAGCAQSSATRRSSPPCPRPVTGSKEPLMRLPSSTAALAARLPRRTVRLRLTALYGGLFLACGTGLLAITNILARSLPGPAFHAPATTHRPTGGPGYLQGIRRSAGFAQQLAHQHAAALNQLLAVSAIALGIMAVASAALGWLVAGRVLRPLREMTTFARAISEDNLHQRLAVPGPGDEMKDLGDTIDRLLERLEAAFEAQRTFVASASHELRTPVTLTRTLLQMILTDRRPTLARYRAI